MDEAPIRREVSGPNVANAKSWRPALLASPPAGSRAATRVVIRLAVAVIPVRGVGKSAFRRSLDMGRPAARRIGQCLVKDGGRPPRSSAVRLHRAAL